MEVVGPRYGIQNTERLRFRNTVRQWVRQWWLQGGPFLLYQGGDELGVSRVYYIAYL